MADFSNTANTGNNPDEWFSNYAYNETTNVVSIDLSATFAGTGVTDADLKADEGDARSVYLAVAEALFKAYDDMDGASSTSSNRLKMTKSQVVQDLPPLDSLDSTTYEHIRYTTYTIHVQEKVETIRATTSTGVRAE